MDHQFYRPMPDRHSKHMENLSLIMGIIALSTFCLVYPALICGAPPDDKIFTKTQKYAEQYRYKIKQERKNKKALAVFDAALIIYAFGVYDKSLSTKSHDIK